MRPSIRAIVWEGPSPVTGAPMALVLSGPSENQKTGPMVQAWLLLSDTPPFEAVRTGADAGICGACVHRAGEKRTCYVSLFNGPRSIYRGIQEHNYPRLAVEDAARLLAGHHLRVTAYGDPAFVPFDVWHELLEHAAGHVGFTHQWATCDPRFASILMASVETEAEAEQAHARGWRTFRARPASAPVRAGEVACPASEEMGHRTTCLACQLCQGAAKRAKSVTIRLHGAGAAARKGIWNKHDELRRELEAGGFAVRADTRANSTRLALAQCYRRRGTAMAIGIRKLRDGLYLFFQRTEANP